MTDNIIWRDFNDAADQIAPGAKLDSGEIRQRLLSRLPSYLEWLLPNGKIRGHRFFVGDVTGSAGDSLVVELDGDRAGMWYDFATGEGGDVFGLWAAVHGLNSQRDFGEILRGAAKWLGLEPEAAKPKPRRREDDRLGAPTDRWDYRDADGQLIACVYRYDLPDGEKEFRPWDVVARKTRMPEPRPLYNLPGIKDATEVVLVEGEKCADALISQGIPATTAMGGASAPVDKTDWTPLTGKHVLIWPDNDEPGRKYARTAIAVLQTAIAVTTAILLPPEDKSKGWDAADAVAEGIDVAEFIRTAEKVTETTHEPDLIPAFSYGHYLDDDSPTPPDLIAPRVLTPGGMLVFGGAPKVGKSDFLLSMLAHMAAGVEFLGMTPSRPLRVFFLQAEVQYPYLRERLRSIPLPDSVVKVAREHLVITPQVKMLLDENGVERAARTITHHFPNDPVDVLVVDPLRNVFDGGEGDAGENDNSAMLTFLQDRLDRLRDRVNPSAGVVLAHHTKKISAGLLKEDPFQGLSGASSLRGYYSAGMIMHRPAEDSSIKRLDIELRNGPAFGPLYVDKVDGQWVAMDRHSERLVNQQYGAKLDAERLRKHDVILQTIFSEAREKRLYVAMQFAETFENRGSLGSRHTIRERLSVLETKGLVKFVRDATPFGFQKTRSRWGYLCVQDMTFGEPEYDVDKETGEAGPIRNRVLPSHFKCPQTGACLPVENPQKWVYPQGVEDELTLMSEA